MKNCDNFYITCRAGPHRSVAMSIFRLFFHGATATKSNGGSKPPPYSIWLNEQKKDRFAVKPVPTKSFHIRYKKRDGNSPSHNFCCHSAIFFSNCFHFVHIVFNILNQFELISASVQIVLGVSNSEICIAV